MSSDWRIAFLEDLIAPGSSITYGVVKPGERDENGVLFIRGGDIADGEIQTSELRTISPAISQQYKRTLLKGGELLVSLVGNPGQVAIVPPSLAGANIARQVGLVRLGEQVEPNFVKYYLLSQKGQEALGAKSKGSVQQVINLKDLKTLKVPVPDLPEQKAIAKILSSLDDKIEHNRRMNATLEAMARALFKAWFVDFEPVHANRENRPSTSASPEIAKLFPSDFENGIPKGWNIDKLENVLELAYGKALTADNRTHGDIPVYGSNGQVGFHNEALVAGPGIVVGRKGNPGTVIWVDESFFPIDTTFFVKSDMDLKFVFHSLENLDLPNLSGDSAVPGLSRSIAYRESLLIPSAIIVEAFREVSEPLSRKMFTNVQENKLLSQIRDSLLPRLISGKIRVGELEKTFEVEAF